jgi:hypothetical protein
MLLTTFASAASSGRAAHVRWDGTSSAQPGYPGIPESRRRTNGTALLKIAFSDGSTGVLTIGCHGPVASPGIFEAIATAKGYKTYYNVPAPALGVYAGRTLFHVR